MGATTTTTTTTIAKSESPAFVRRRRRTTTMLLPILLILGVLSSSCNAGVESTELRRAAASLAGSMTGLVPSSLEDRLLFWSSYDFNVDAATQLFGPLDLVLRGGAFEGGDSAQQAQVVDELFEVSTETLERELDREVDAAEAASLASATSSSDLYEALSSSNTTGTSAAAAVVRNEGIARFSRGGARSSSSTTITKVKNLVYSLFQENDGSESDPDGIPTRYQLMHPNDRKAAKKSLEDTLEWRKEHGIDNILNTPQPKYDLCKTVYPHYFLGRDKLGRVVLVQRPAKLDLERGLNNGLTEHDLLFHYVFVNEYLWQVLEGDRPLSTMTSIIDLQGLNFGVLRRPDILGFTKKFVSTMDSYYPQRAHKTLLLNAPKWFRTLYKLLSPLLRETTKSKIEIHTRGKKQDEALRALMDQTSLDLLPANFWSTWKKNKRKPKNKRQLRKEKEAKANGDDTASETSSEASDEDEAGDDDDEEPLVPPPSELERELREFVVARLEAEGATMQVVV